MASPGTMDLAWRRAKKDQGDDLVCGDFVLEGLKGHRKDVLDEVEQKMADGAAYVVGPVGHLRVPKSPLTTRPGCVLTPLDRIAYHWLVDKLYSVLEPRFPPPAERVVLSYRYCGKPASDTPVRGSHRAFLETSRELARGGGWVVSADLTRYFERIDHGVLALTLTDLGADYEVTASLMSLLRGWLPPGLSCGLPQSQDPSGYLATALLLQFDEFAVARSAAYCRYTDDMTVVLPTRDDARKWLTAAETELWELGLALNCQKTRVESADDFLLRKSAHQDALERHLNPESAWMVSANAYGSGGQDDVEMDAILALVDDHDAFVALFREEVQQQPPSLESLRPCLREFMRLNPVGALEYVLPNLGACLHAGRTLEQYLLVAAEDEPDLAATILEALTSQLAFRRALTDWQAMWALHCCYRLEAADRQLADVAMAYVTTSRDWPEPVAAHAMLLAGWDGDEETQLKMLACAARDGRPWVGYGAIAGVQALNKRDRNSFLSRIGRTEPVARLLGDCVKQGAFEAALAARHGE